MSMPSLTAIGHRGMEICNPVSESRLLRVLEHVDPRPGARVLDLGCGKGALLRLIAANWRGEERAMTLVGVDRDADLIAEAEAAMAVADHASPITFVCADAARYVTRPEAAGQHLVCALGASHIFGGTAGCLTMLADLTAPGGMILLGEGFWEREPEREYLAAIDGSRDELMMLGEIVASAAAHGLQARDVSVASVDEWDRYEWAHFRNVEDYANVHSRETAAQALLVRRRTWLDTYLRWRGTMGFGLFLFRRVR